MEEENNNLLTLGIIILLAGILILSYSISSFVETKNLADKISFDELDNNTHMSTSEKYYKYLDIADYLNIKLSKNKDIPMKNTSCIYLDYAQHNAISLYRLAYSGVQTEETRKSIAAGTIRALYNMLDNYKTCSQTADYKSKLQYILDEIEKKDKLYTLRDEKMEAFLKPKEKNNIEDLYLEENNNTFNDTLPPDNTFNVEKNSYEENY